MKKHRSGRFIFLVVSVFLLRVGAPAPVWALEETDVESHNHPAHQHTHESSGDQVIEQEAGNGGEHQQHQQEGNDAATTTPHHHEAAYTVGSPATGAHHHHHRAPVLPPEEDQAYSELNHQIAGVFVFLAGGFALAAASGNPRFTWAQYSWPLLFFLMGLFLFVRHDPESWPWGPLPLLEAIQDPQVLQHTLFTLIVLGIGVIEWLRCRGRLTHPGWGLIFPVLAVSAAAMLFLHKHGEGPSADKIYRHHVIMAIAGIVAMVAKVLDDAKLLKTHVGGYIWSALMMFIGFMLLIYTE